MASDAVDRPALNVRRETGSRIIIDDGGVGELLAALELAPLSCRLKELLLSELLDTANLNSGPEGVTCCSDMTALGTGDFTGRVDLGRAGKALVAALWALAGLSLDEVGDCAHCHCSLDEITPEMTAAGAQELAGFVTQDLMEGFMGRHEVAEAIYRAMRRVSVEAG